MKLGQDVLNTLTILGKFWQEKFNWRIVRWNGLLIILQLLYLTVKFDSLPAVVPLYYSLPWGKSRLAPASSLFLLPSLSLGVALLDSLLAAVYLATFRLASRLLVLFSMIFSLLSLVTLLQIINLVA